MANKNRKSPEFEMAPELKKIFRANSERLAEVSELNKAFADFCSRRVNSYVPLASELANCRSFEDVLKLQSDFIDRFYSDYQREAQRFFDRARSMTLSGLEKTTQTYEDSILKAQDDAKLIISQAKDQAARIIAEAEGRVSDSKLASRKSA